MPYLSERDKLEAERFLARPESTQIGWVLALMNLPPDADENWHHRARLMIEANAGLPEWIAKDVQQMMTPPRARCSHCGR